MDEGEREETRRGRRDGWGMEGWVGEERATSRRGR